MRKRGFTLLEVMVVISVIAILASILLPVFARARESARRATCASNLHQLGAALNMYAQNYDGRYPKRNNEFAPVYRYASCIDVFYCPSDSAEHYWDLRFVDSQRPYGPGEVPRRTYSSYVYRGGLSNDDRADRVIAGEAQTWHGDLANVLHLGGYVKGVCADDYKPIVAQTQKPVDKDQPKPIPPTPGAPMPMPSAPPAPGM